MASLQDGALTKHTTFESIMHKKTAQTDQGFSAMLKKDKNAQRAAVAEYFQHWDNKEAKTETEADRFVSPTSSTTRSYLDAPETTGKPSQVVCTYGP